MQQEVVGYEELFPGFDVALVLGGGNALGAYHLGVCERLLAAGLEPSWFVGTSIGAVTAAILVGNSRESRLDRLRAFWRDAAQAGSPWGSVLPRELRARLNNDQALIGLLLGRPGLFAGRYPGIWSLLPFMPPDRGIRDHKPLADTLRRLIDFDRLNRSELRFSFAALDIETGAEVWFENGGGVQPEHLLAATAFAPLFPPVEIDGRLLCDAGFGHNLPVNRVFDEIQDRNLACVASDLYHLRHGRPATLDETAARTQDLTFALQTRRAIDGLIRERRLMRRIDPSSPAAILGHLAFQPPGHQRTLKSLDYSQRSIEERVRQGQTDAAALLARLRTASRTDSLAYVGPIEMEGPEASRAPVPQPG